MIGRQQLVNTVAIQAAGSAATILTVVVVASRFGPEGQGYWAAYRSVLDVLVALAIYGFPQGFPFVINRMNVLPARILAFALRYLALAWPMIAGSAVVALAAGWIKTGGLLAIDAPTLILAGLFLVAHSLLRGIALAASKTLIFNLITVIPACVQLALVVVWPANQLGTLPWAITAASLLSLVACTGIVRRDIFAPPADVREDALNRRHLMTYGFWWFLIALLQVAIPLVLYQLLLTRGFEVSTIGNFSVALMVVGAGLLPISMVGPLIFNGLTKTVSEAERQVFFVHTGRWLMLAAIGATVIFVTLAPQLMSVLFDDRFAEATSLAVVMLISIPAAYYTRLAANIMTSAGSPHHYVLLLAFRVACTVVPCVVIEGGAQMMAWFYTFGEIVAAGCAAVLLQRVLHWPWRSVMLVHAETSPGKLP